MNCMHGNRIRPKVWLPPPGIIASRPGHEVTEADSRRMPVWVADAARGGAESLHHWTAVDGGPDGKVLLTFSIGA